MNSKFVELKTYCSTLVVVDRLSVPGRTAAAAAPGGTSAAAGQAGLPLMEQVLTLSAQRTIHGMLDAADGVFSTWSAFTDIHSGTFLVDEVTGMVIVIVSAQGLRETEQNSDLHQLVADINVNLRLIAACIRCWMFPDKNPVPVIEVEQGLLYMLEQEGYFMWDAIRSHSSLVPLVNRPDLLIRLHDHLVNVVVTTNLSGYWSVLGMLQAAAGGQWHAAALINNTHLAAFYYNPTDRTPEVQAYQLLRYHRNPCAHGLEHSVPAGPVDPSTVPAAPLPAAALPKGFVPRIAAQTGDTPVQQSFVRWQIGLMQYSEWPLFLHYLERGMQMIGELGSTWIQFLFVYPRR